MIILLNPLEYLSSSHKTHLTITVLLKKKVWYSWQNQVSIYNPIMHLSMVSATPPPPQSGTYRRLVGDLTIVNTITRMGDLTLGVVNNKWPCELTSH